MVEREERDGVVVLRLARPPVNALDVAALAGLADALAQTGDAPVVLTGAGSAFTAGVDTRAVATGDAEVLAGLVRGINALVAALLAVPGPLVAALNGHAIGAGTIAALACDRVVATTAACRIGLTEAAAGVPFPAGALTVVQRALAPPVATDLALSARTFGPQEALALGIAHELVDPTAVVATAVERARALAALPGFPGVKEQLRRDLRAAVATAVAHEPLLAGVG